ncbi:hypothetical protein CJF32_00010754 [Rutstroemia sp. NJR-2017a WRK4]|nr:hypothetical protein CJF32_00010754 [Rutstroemia sp. NJR-2017a WRK4]
MTTASEPRRLKRHDWKREFMGKAAEAKQTPLAKPGRVNWRVLREDGARSFLLGGHEIKVHLEKHSDPVLKPVTWTIYMIGRTKDTARPTIMFISKEEDSRKKIRKTVEESGILDGYLGVRLGDCSRPPDFDRLVELAIEDAVISNLDTPGTVNVLLSDQNQEMHRPGGVLREASNTVCGSRIFIRTEGSTISFRKATAGGILRSGDRFFYLTVAHAFTHTLDYTASITENCESDFEFDIGGDLDSDLNSDSDQEERDFVEKTSRGSVTPERSNYATSDETETPVDALPSVVPYLNVALGREDSKKASHRVFDTASNTEISDIAPLGFRDPSFEDAGQVFTKSSELDYCLIEISNPELQTFNRIHPSHSLLQEALCPERVVTTLPANTNVLAVTGSTGILKGTLSGTPSFIMRQGSAKQKELWTVRLDGRLYDGDCGSWVVEARSGDLLGHIVSGCPESGVAYIVPAYLVLEDVMTRCGLELKLSIAGDASCTPGNSQQVIVRVTDTSRGGSEIQGFTGNTQGGMNQSHGKMKSKRHMMLEYDSEDEQVLVKSIYNSVRSTTDSSSKSFTYDFESSNSVSDETTSTTQTDYTGFSDEGAAEVVNLLCDFRITGCRCEFSLTQFDAWYEHTLSHFGDLPPPPMCVCLFCFEEFEDKLHPHDNWRRRMLHCYEHMKAGEYIYPRPDFWLIEYLAETHLISADDLAFVTNHKERPLVDGLVPRDFETLEARYNRYKRTLNTLQREERGRKKMNQKRGK